MAAKIAKSSTDKSSSFMNLMLNSDRLCLKSNFLYSYINIVFIPCIASPANTVIGSNAWAKVHICLLERSIQEHFYKHRISKWLHPLVGGKAAFFSTRNQTKSKALELTYFTRLLNMLIWTNANLRISAK